MKHLTLITACVFVASLSLESTGFAQTRAATLPDAQVESNVLRTLASDPKLAVQTITSNTVYGTVTLSGTVRDEESRRLAETIVSKTPGVQKVIDELTLASDGANAGTQPGENPAPPSADDGSNPLLQSDGTMASAPPQTSSRRDTQPARPAPDARSQTAQQQSHQPPYDQPPSDRQPYGRPSPDRPQDQGDRGYQAQQPPAGPNGPPYRRPYSRPPYGPPAGYQQPPDASESAYGAQPGGLPVTVSSGSTLRVRINQELDSRQTQPGTVFDAVVLSDVIADGSVAIPRGAAVQGVVVGAESAGALKGRGQLSLQLTQVTLAGKTYPLVSDVWSNHGGDKTARTVNSAIGLGAVGAIIGGVAGGGAGAAIGAGAGGAAGIGASAASGGGQAIIPAEAILSFRLTQQVALTTVSQAEMNRLGYGVSADSQMHRRYAQPVPYRYPVYYYPRYPYPYAYPY